MKVEIENLSEVKRKLLIEVPSGEVIQEIDRAYRQLGKSAKVKGFRPGKVPRSVLEMYYHKQIEQEVADTLVRLSLADALKEKSLEPVHVSWPEAPPPAVSGEDYRFSVELEVPPEFTVEDYLGLALTAPAFEVTDAVVKERLEGIRQANALLRPLPESRPIADGDFVILDYQGYFAGQMVEGAKGEGIYLEVGTGKFNAEFERNLLGLAEGAKSRFAVSLPDDFFNPLIAGKVVEFQVKILEVKEKVEPDLDDAFAKSLGGDFQTLADLRHAVREDIIKEKERERQGRLENQALDELLARHPFEVPPSLLQQEQESMFRDQWERMGQQGINPQGLDWGKMLEAMRPMAERRVRTRLLLGRIAAQEGITVDDAELNAGLARIAVKSGRGVAQVRKFYEDNDLMEKLRSSLRDEKTMRLVLDKATVTAAAPAQEAE